LGLEKAAHLKKERAAVAGRRREEAAGLKLKLAGLEKELMNTKKRLRDAAAAEQKAGAEAEDAGKICAELEEAKKKAERNAKEMAALRERRKGAEGKAGEISFALKEMEGLLEKKRILGKAREREGELEKEWKGIHFSSEEFEKLHSKTRELMVGCERAGGKAREARKAIASLREMIAALGKEMGLLEAVKADVRKRKEMLEQLVIMRNAIGETQAELRMELVEAINAAMNGIWPILYPYADYRQLRIAASEEDYAFEVYDGEWRRLEKVASGGERACLSLTLRIAMATVLAPEAGWLILDEPTHNLDRGAVQALAEALEDKVPQLVEQAFVITHEENLMNSEFARSYRFSRDKESGGATVVEEL
jgi:DNA repair exonuclease SbcCD ATPase subunit